MTGDNFFQLALVLHIGAAFLFLSGRQRWALLTLLAGGVLLRYYFATLDPFLHDWDERFHALVAKNLTEHWLLPTLVEHPILPHTSHDWTTAHIWLHKQPLFLWQMALSIKLLGATELAVRLPSLIMTSVLIIIVYQMGRMVLSPVVGFIAAFIFSGQQPLLEMNSGLLSMDHNDIAFLFYVTLSIWAWLHYERRQRRRYLILMGLTAGFAVLCKWLTGLLVFSGFAFYHLLAIRDLFTWQVMKDLGISLTATLFTSIPWQLFILWQYPVEASYEYAYNSKHFFEVVEGHEHERWFYINTLPEYYHEWQYLLIVGLVVALLLIRRAGLAAALSFMIVVVYAFFTVAETKLPSYVMVVMPLALLVIARLPGWLLEVVWHKRLIRYMAGGTLFIILLVVFINRSGIIDNHFDPDNWQGRTRAFKMSQAILYKKLQGKLPDNSVVLGLSDLQDIDMMFYTGVPAYGASVEQDYRFLKDHRYRVIFWGDAIPAYARGDSGTYASTVFLTH